MDWPPLALFQPSPVSMNSARRGSRLGDMRKTCPNQRNLLSCTTCSNDLPLTPNTLRLTSALLIRLSHQTRAMLRRHRCSNTEIQLISSARRGQVSEPYSKTGLTAAVYTRPLTDKRISRLRHKCLRLANAARAFCMRDDTSSAMVPPGQMRLPI